MHNVIVELKHAMVSHNGKNSKNHKQVFFVFLKKFPLLLKKI